jgi:hypothetical protein
VWSGGWLRAQMHQFCGHQTSFFMKLCSLTPGQLSRCAMYIQAFHWKLSLSLKASYVLAVSKANNLDMFGATICTKVEKFRQTYHFIIMYILHYENKFTKLMYSKASRYTALRSTDLGYTRFLIGSQNTWDTRFLAKSLEDARFFLEIHGF